MAETQIIIFLIVGGLSGIGIAALLTLVIAQPVRGLTYIMRKLAGGTLDIEVTYQDRKDELGMMANALQVFKESMIETKELHEGQLQEAEAKEQRRAAMEALTGEFESAAVSMLKEVSAASEAMRKEAENMAETASVTSHKSTMVASAAEEASVNVQTVAAASEELSQSVSEIGRQVDTARQIATDAVDELQGANEKIRGLEQASQAIGDVVALITDIAEQTNLLALNATIEAARAGDAGKGFAVVASEVKNLANQTGKATEEISSQINSIQSATRIAVEAVDGISGTIGKISEVTTAISSAVEEQGSATQEIARNVEQASAGTSDVSSNIMDVNVAANETGQAAERVRIAVDGLGAQSDQLETQVHSFIGGVNSV